jgi:hypothetical protein
VIHAQDAVATFIQPFGIRQNLPSRLVSNSILRANPDTLRVADLSKDMPGRRRFAQVIVVKFQRFLIISLLPGLLFVCARRVTAQSADQNLPTPVLANEITGKISPLDLGDARVTRHFYAFEANPGDLLITMDSRNLNGDMDIFTAITFRPLVKTTIYANSQSPEVTKGIYLRTRQILILRVEARTPSDEQGTYRVRFGGTFATFSGGIPVAENVEPESDSNPRRGSKRLSSVGASIAEPVVEAPSVTAETKSEGNPTEKPAEDPDAEKKAAAEKAAAEKTAAEMIAAETIATEKIAADKARTTKSTTRNTRGRTPRPVRPKPAKSNTAAAKTSKPKTDEAKPEEKPAEDSGKSETSEKPSTQELPIPGAHLIIESKDGTRMDRPMSTVRRVVVEGGMIVIVLKTGKTERVRLSEVARMAIEP